MLRDSFAAYTPGVSERRAGVSTFLHSGLKDATAQTSAAQAVTASRVYDAFGMVVASTGTWKGPFGYSGEHGYQEESTGLQLLGHRYYDPSTGRFLTRDPAYDGRNWYVYCNSSVVATVDPDGLQPARPPLRYFPPRSYYPPVSPPFGRPAPRPPTYRPIPSRPVIGPVRPTPPWALPPRVVVPPNPVRRVPNQGGTLGSPGHRD